MNVAEIPGRGRSLVASQHIRAGQILLQDSPILLYPSTLSPSISSSYCSNCFRNLDPSSSLLPCPTCPNNQTTTTGNVAVSFFCGPTCRSSALASSHSPWVCRSLALIPSLPHHLQAQALFLVSAYNLASVSPPFFSLLLSLHGDTPSSSSDSMLAALHSFVSSLSPPPLAPSTPPGAAPTVVFSAALTAALLAKDKHNAFGLMEPFSEGAANAHRSVRAYGIYPTASFFNHDCLPNACRFDYIDARDGSSNNTDIIVRAIHDIEQGREICLSYFPVNWSYADRQKRLLEDYGFVCDCDRCQVERNWRHDDDEVGGGGDDDEGMMEEDTEHHHDDIDQGMEDTVEEEEEDNDNDDFPHAYFFVRYLCQRDNCGGTLAPLPPSDDNGMPAGSNTLECNVCGHLSKEEDRCGDDRHPEDENMLDK